MLNIDAPPDTFAYKIAVENKQLGWFLTDYKFNLFDLIFKTLELLENPLLKEYYFDWDLELSFFFTSPKCVEIPQSNYTVTNIPYILENSEKVKKTLKNLNLTLKKDGFNLYYLESTKVQELSLPSYIFPYPMFSKLLDFWRYFFYYSKKNAKDNIKYLLEAGCMGVFPYVLAQKNPDLFSNISKQDLRLLSTFSHVYYEHDLDFIDPTNLIDVKNILKLEKNYGIEFYALLEKLKRLPSEKELGDWVLKQTISYELDVKISVLPNKKLEVEYGWCIYELTTISDLEKEAKLQKNCLAGYISELKTTKFRFFSIRKKDLIFSVLFRDDTLVEIKGFKNQRLETYSKEIREEIEYTLFIIKEKIQDGNKKLISQDIFS